MTKINPIIKLWLTPKLPAVHIREKSANPLTIVKKWLIHPIKRRVARLYLKFLQVFTPIRVIGITGSAGKTTTKEMLAAILKLSDKTIWSKENIDPVYNIPTTILRTPIGTKYLILEMGVEYPGEMDFYLWLAKPDVGIITNIFPTHTEFFGDIEGVFKEKSKLAYGLSKNSAIALNSADPRLVKLSKSLKSNVLLYNSDKGLVDQDAKAAQTVAKYFGIDGKLIEKGLSSYSKPEHRFNVIKLKSGAVLVDDSYNSNPEAALASLKMFLNLAKNAPKVAVMGDMLELGKYEEEGHRKVGKELSKMGFASVIGVGSASAYIIEEILKRPVRTKTVLVDKPELALPFLKPHLKDGVYIFVKGSRSIGLDRLVSAISHLR